MESKKKGDSSGDFASFIELCKEIGDTPGYNQKIVVLQKYLKTFEYGALFDNNNNFNNVLT